MAELIAKAVLDGQVPVSKAGLVLSLAPAASIWSIALYPGAQVDKVLKPLGLAFPAPGKSVTAGGGILVWTGWDQAFLFGQDPPGGLADHAALSDQTGAWAGFTLAGAQAGEALARLVPIDLRASVFAPQDVARTALNHIPLILRRSAEAEFTLHVFRSMAASAWRELSEVLDRLAARELQGGRA